MQLELPNPWWRRRGTGKAAGESGKPRRCKDRRCLIQRQENLSTPARAWAWVCHGRKQYNCNLDRSSPRLDACQATRLRLRCECRSWFAHVSPEHSIKRRCTADAVKEHAARARAMAGAMSSGCGMVRRVNSLELSGFQLSCPYRCQFRCNCISPKNVEDLGIISTP